MSRITMQVSSPRESFVAAVPLRGGSKSIPFKNIKEFCGVPLCWWTLKALLGANSISRIFVTTDCDKIAGVVSSMDSRIHIHRRPDHLATDTATTEAAVIDLIDACDIRDKFVVTAQVTSPQTTSNDVDAAVAHLLALAQICWYVREDATLLLER